MGEGQESRYHAHTLLNQRGEDEAAYVATYALRATTHTWVSPHMRGGNT